MTLQFKQVPLILIMVTLLVGVLLWQQPRGNNKPSSRTVPPTPKPSPREPMARATPVSTSSGTSAAAYGVDEIILGMNQTAVEHAQKAYADTMAGFTPRDTRPLSERAKDRQKGWHPPVPANK